jgi:hypothetical protein
MNKHHMKHFVCLMIGVIILVMSAIACFQSAKPSAPVAPVAGPVQVVLPDGRTTTAVVVNETIPASYHDSGTTYKSPRFALTFNPLESAPRQVFDHKPFESKQAPNPAVDVTDAGVKAKAQKTGDSFVGEGPQPALNALFSYLPWGMLLLGIVIIVPTIWSWVKSILNPVAGAVTGEVNSLVALIHKALDSTPKPPTP